MLSDLPMKIFIIHGSYGSPDENWLPWLKKELEALGHQVTIPKFPTPENQSLTSWIKVIERYNIDKDSIVIGHSLGPAFLLHIIENQPVKAAFFVAPFISALNKPEFDKVNETFYIKKINWNQIKRNCTKFYIFHSDNDPYVPLEKAKELANKLGVKAILVKGAGHFNVATGYDKFELLLEKIKGS